MFSRSVVLALGAVAALVLPACGGQEAGTADNPRTVEVETLDEFRFEPSEVTVEAGETIRFVVSNPGAVVHEFVLGPEHVQMAHEDAGEMGEHMEMDVEGQLAALDLEPGETKEVTVNFDELREILFGCHEPGHYQAGMVGTVTVEG